jgi:hypothetical protein
MASGSRWASVSRAKFNYPVSARFEATRGTGVRTGPDVPVSS